MSFKRSVLAPWNNANNAFEIIQYIIFNIRADFFHILLFHRVADEALSKGSEEAPHSSQTTIK